MVYELQRPGSDVWETGVTVPLGEVVGCLVRYHTGGAPFVMRVAELLPPDADGRRALRFEPYQPEGVTA